MNVGTRASKVQKTHFWGSSTFFLKKGRCPNFHSIYQSSDTPLIFSVKTNFDHSYESSDTCRFLKKYNSAADTCSTVLKVRKTEKTEKTDLFTLKKQTSLYKQDDVGMMSKKYFKNSVFFHNNQDDVQKIHKNT